LATNTLSYELGKLIREVPGYDPYAQAGESWLDDDAAALAVEFVETCCSHVKGKWAGTPFTMEPWQRAIIANLFGWKRADGSRRYREALVYVPRKNGKTCLAAAILNYLLFVDNEPGAEIYCAAADREQATLVYSHAVGMVRQSAEMSRRAKIYATSKTTEYQERRSFYRAISSEAGTKHGYNAHGIIIDELHAQPNRELVDVLLTSTGARTQPVVVHITTADYERESVCNEKHDYACGVRDGRIDDSSFLPVIYQATRDDDWTDRKVWAAANPNLNVSIGEEYLARECERAKNSPAYVNTFKRLHLNIRTESISQWLDMGHWDQCFERFVLVDVRHKREDMACLPCYAGVDLSKSRDMTALAMMFPDATGYRQAVRYWLPQETIDKHRHELPYDQWIDGGWLTPVPGATIPANWIKEQLVKALSPFDVQAVVYDPWGARVLAEQIADEHGLNMLEMPQTVNRFAEPTAEYERLVIEHKLRHDGNAVLRWQASHCQVRSDPNTNIRPVKPVHGDIRTIDGIVAGIMALSAAVTHEGDGGVYDSPDAELFVV
jgi:phage terminase large subunit-like protein